MSTSGIVTLISDMSYKGYYVASVKGTILSAHRETQIIDITHQVPAFDITKAAFILKNCYANFPKGSIHLIGVNPELNADTSHVLVKYNEHYFIGADNGIFSLLFNEIPADIYELTLEQETDNLTFPLRDVFAKAACHLLRGGTPELIAKRRNTLKQVLSYQPIIDNDSIRGSVVFIDSYGNIITNITKKMFDTVGKTRPFRINYSKLDYIENISKNYNDVPEGEKLALFTSSGDLQISINKGVEGHGGSPRKLFGIKLYDIIVIEFSNSLL